MYTLVLIIHLMSAIIFLGFIFADVIILGPAKIKAEQESLEKNSLKKFWQLIAYKKRKIYPFVVALLFLTGGYMLSNYINYDLGMFNLNLQLLLLVKVSLATPIGLGVLYSITQKIRKKQLHPYFEKYFHKSVFILGFFIIILSKAMFVF